MVRVNIINPKKLTDQHLIAEYVEILMLAAYVRKHPEASNLPECYCLGKGHIRFFKDKMLYLKKRHEELKKEMKRRGFAARKTLSLKGMKKELINDWKPKEKDFMIIRKRLLQKLSKKPGYYRYCGKNRKYLLNLYK